MSRSNWGEWVKPDRSHMEVAGLGTSIECCTTAEELADCGDPSQPEPVDVAISSERGRPILMPLFPVGFFTPHSGCPHRGQIPSGSSLCCMVCHQSGMDGHPSLQETAVGAMALKNWKPEGGKDQWTVDEHVTAAPTRYEGKQKARTRKQKRSEQRPTA